MGVIYYKCPDCGCWRKEGKPVMLTGEGEDRIMTHIKTVGATINRTDWRCPKCKINTTKEA